MIADSIHLIAAIAEYADTQVVLFLSPGDSTLVTFLDWTVPSAVSVTYLFSVCSEVPGDADSTNDCETKAIFARGLGSFLVFPNPFSGETVIYYKLSRPAHVVLKIYDIAGRLVITLVNEEKNAGSYTVPWNGEDDSGQRVGSGVYFSWIEARIGQARDFIRTRKLILLR